MYEQRLQAKVIICIGIIISYSFYFVGSSGIEPLSQRLSATTE